MDNVDRRVIQLYMDVLSHETNFSNLWRELIKYQNIITSNLEKKYKELQEKGASEYALNTALYTDIQTRGKKAFGILINSLKELHPHLAELLLPCEIVPPPICDNVAVSANDEELTEYQGICTVSADEKIRNDLIAAVKGLCRVIKAKFVFEDVGLTQATFHLSIRAGGKFEEKDIEAIEAEYNNQSMLKIILINIISGSVKHDLVNSNSKPIASQGCCASLVFIVNIHIHQGDHIPSVINIVKEVIANNQGYDIRDVFRVVMEKLSKWNCSLNTESRSFPYFHF